MSRGPAQPRAPFFRSELQAQMLALLVAHPNEWLTAAEATPPGRTVQGVHVELRRLAESGIVEIDRSTRTHRFRLDASSALHDPLTLLVERTVGVEAQIRSVVESVEHVVAASIYGSWARAEITGTSDVDVLVLHELPIDVVALGSELMEVGGRMRRDINHAIFTVSEARELRQGESGFIQNILASPMIDLVGSVKDVIEGAAP